MVAILKAQEQEEIEILNPLEVNQTHPSHFLKIFFFFLQLKIQLVDALYL
jgi:hypothetical protein